MGQSHHPQLAERGRLSKDDYQTGYAAETESVLPSPALLRKAEYIPEIYALK